MYGNDLHVREASIHLFEERGILGETRGEVTDY